MNEQAQPSVIFDGAIRVSALCALGGLFCVGVSVVRTTPMTFLIFAGVGVPLLLVGAAVFLRGLFVGLTKKGAL